MAHFEHKPAAPQPVNEAEAARNARYGLILFAIYAVLYGTFMLLVAFAPQSMEVIVVAGLNLAVVYGLGLIAAALLLALLYAWLCRHVPQPAGPPPDPEGGP